MTNPLSPLTYHRRHKRAAAIQIVLICLSTIGLFVLVAVLDTIPQRGNVSYLTAISRVIPIGNALEPALVARIRAYPGVTRVLADNGLTISLPTLVGLDSQRLMGVSQEDALVIMRQCGVRLKDGRMFEPRSNEVVLSEEIARALALELGDEVSRSVSRRFYDAVATPMVLVGTLEGDPANSSEPNARLGFVSGEYLSSHELYAPRTTSLLVIAEPQQKASVDTFLETTIDAQTTDVETFTEVSHYVRAGRVLLYVIFGIVNSVVAAVMAFAVGAINQIAIARRMGELGVLHALGHQKPRLTQRLTLATTMVAGVGYLLGMGGALLVMLTLKNSLFYSLGMELDLWNPAPFLFVLPAPAIVVALAHHSARRTFARLDAVAVVERGQLSTEEQHVRWHSHLCMSKPLSARTFYRRHRRRGVLMTLTTALLVLSVTLPSFLLSAMSGAMLPTLDYLRYVTRIDPLAKQGIDPGVAAHIRSHPTVRHAIPVIQLGIQIVVPPAGETTVGIYGVYGTDVEALVEAFGVQVREGRLPRPRSNEIALTATIAANRDLKVGDLVGGQDRATGAFISDDLPVEMVIVGLLSPDLPVIGLASREYLEGHELTSGRNPTLLLIPQDDQKDEMDSWLQESIASGQIDVTTHTVRQRDFRELTASLTLTFALLECMIAAVAAATLATLNIIFFAQRKEEYGILNAIGRSYRWLVGRTMLETGSVAGLAWVIGAGLCGIGLLAIQALLYAPRGLTMDFRNLTPWIFTLPLPLTVALASTATIAHVLRRLDPIAVIEGS